MGFERLESPAYCTIRSLRSIKLEVDKELLLDNLIGTGFADPRQQLVAHFVGDLVSFF